MTTRYAPKDRVRVIDPADKRKRISGTVVEINEGRGSMYYKIVLDDDPTPMGFSPDEIAGHA